MSKVKSFSKVMILLLVTFVISIFAFGCKKDSPDFKIYDSIFVDKFSSEDDIDSIHVSSLTAYYYEDKYYYVVEYIQDGDDFEYELLYILEHGGNGMTMFKNGRLLFDDSTLTDADVLIEYVQNHLNAKVGEEYEEPLGEGRITVKGL